MLEDSRAVLGVAAVSGHVYVVRAESPEMEVYSAVTLSLKRRVAVAGLRSPTDLVACQRSGCLFVCDWSECRIHRVSVLETRRREGLRTTADGGEELAVTTMAETSSEVSLNDEETGWWTSERPWSLSLVEGHRRGTVLVTCDQVGVMYSAKEIMFSPVSSVYLSVCLSLYPL